jgi:hypothetical protein
MNLGTLAKRFGLRQRARPETPVREPETVYEPRPMTGFFAALTPEQQKAALEYRGPENHGLPDAPKRAR